LIDPTRCDMDRRYPAREGNEESPRGRRGPHRLVRPGEEQNRSGMAVRLAAIGVGARAHIAQHARADGGEVGGAGDDGHTREKPLDITTAAADAVLEAAFTGGGKLYIGHNMRHMSLVRGLKQVIDRGEIGEVKAIWCRHFVGHGGDYYFKDWHAEREKTGGLLLQKGAHDIDVMHYLARGYTTRVAGMGQLGVYNQIAHRRDNSDRRMRQWFSLANWPPLS